MGVERTHVSEFVGAALETVTPPAPSVPIAPPDFPPSEEPSRLEREQDAQGVRLANPPPADDTGDVSGDGQGD